MTRIIGEVRAAWFRRRAGQVDKFYEAKRSPADIRKWQLARFNDLWRTIAQNSPYYMHLKRQGQIPVRFADWNEFSEKLPVLTRETASRFADDMRTSSRRADYRRITGGSTSEPIRLPAWNTEDRITGLDSWRGRSWFGVDASNRLFLLWGHSHLLGEGFGRWLGGKWRAIKDLGFGYCRYSAYDLSETGLRKAAQALLRFRPSYIIGYSVALHRLAHVNQQLQNAFHDLNLKVVIATGESFPLPESSALIARIFGCPVAMEYGAVETGIIAHQRPDSRFQIFWANYFVEGIESKRWPGCYELLVTTLYPRLVPLIRYRIGDLVCGNPSATEFDQTLEKVVGRCNDGVLIGGNAFVHSEAFSHVLRDVVEIQAFQIIQKGAGEIIVNYIADRTLTNKIEVRLHRRFEKVDKRLKVDRFHRVGRLQESVSGKTKRVVNESESRLI